MPRRPAPTPATSPSGARKQPSQGRSRVLVSSILEATARILVHDGWDGITTNRVAREAGVSVGSLYQYFPHKEALVAALVENWADGVAKRFAALGPALAEAPVDRAITAVVDTALAVTREVAALQRSVLALPQIGALPAYERLNSRAADVLAEWIALRGADMNVDDPSLTAWVIVAALDGLTEQALALRPDLLEGRRLAGALDRLVAGCLGVPAPAPR
jgi:AcrR family transcriptional regulator